MTCVVLTGAKSSPSTRGGTRCQMSGWATIAKSPRALATYCLPGLDDQAEDQPADETPADTRKTIPSATYAPALKKRDRFTRRAGGGPRARSLRVGRSAN